MAKQSGIGSSFFVGTVDLSGDIGSVQQAETMRAEQRVTGIDKSAEERILLRRDGTLVFNSWWNAAAGQAHATLSALPTTDVQTSLFIGSAVGDAAASMVAKQMGYPLTLGEDGSLVASTTASANGYGLEWSGGGPDGMLTTGKQTFASGTQSGASIDLGDTDTSFGAAAYLHVFSLGSGTPTVTVQDSANDSTFATVTGMQFTAITGATTERVQGAVDATVRRYVRIQVTGTYTNLVCAVNFIRYEADPSL